MPCGRHGQPLLYRRRSHRGAGRSCWWQRPSRPARGWAASWRSCTGSGLRSSGSPQRLFVRLASLTPVGVQSFAGDMPRFSHVRLATITRSCPRWEKRRAGSFVEKSLFLKSFTKTRGSLMNILIVDDEPEVAEVLAKSLNRQGHRTTVVHSGADALKAVGTAAPDAIFLDISMPGMNGLDVLSQLPRTKPSLAVVVITGHATPDEIDEVKRLG